MFFLWKNPKNAVYFRLFSFILVYFSFLLLGFPVLQDSRWPPKSHHGVDMTQGHPPASAWTGGVYPRLYSASIAIRVTERLMAEMPAGESLTTFPGPWWLDALVSFGSAVTLAHSNCGVGVAGTFHLAILVLGGCPWVIPTPWRDLGGHLELCRTRNQN